MPEFLDQDIKFLPGVGPRRASLLNSELKIYTFRDLLYYFPFKYVDRTRFYAIREIDTKLPYIQVKGRITGTEVVGEGRSQRLVAFFTDGTGVLELVWFKGIKYVRSSLKTNIQYVVFGKATEFNGQYNIVHPELEEAGNRKRF